MSCYNDYLHNILTPAAVADTMSQYSWVPKLKIFSMQTSLQISSSILGGCELSLGFCFINLGPVTLYLILYWVMASYINALSLPMCTHLLMQCCYIQTPRFPRYCPDLHTKTRFLNEMEEVNAKYCPQKRAQAASCCSCCPDYLKNVLASQLV